MADNYETNAGSGGAVFASDDLAGVHYPYAKLAFGGDGTATLVAAGAGLPVAQQTGATFTVVGAAADGAAAAGNPVLIGGFDGTNAQSLSVTTGGHIHIHDGGNTITVDGTVGVSGTVTVDGSGVTQPVSNAGLTELAAAINASSQLDVNIAASGATVPVSNAGLTELAAAINASSQMDVNIAASGATVPISHAALTELAAAIDTEVQVDIVGALPAGTNNIGDVDVLSVVPGTGATNLGKAADAVAGATDTGVVPLAIRDDALSTLTPAEGDYAPLRVSSTGALHVTGGGGGVQYNIDDAASATATGTVALVVRKDSAASLAGTDGDVSALQVDANGALRVTGGGGGTEYTVDAAAPAAPTGATFVMERDDALSALTEVEGDWTNPRASANGALWVSVDGTVTVGSHAVTNAGTFAVQVDGAALTALQLLDDTVFAEDVAAQAADKGVAVLAVRRDADTSLVGTDNDYANLQVDANGRLKVEAFSGETLPVSLATLPASTNTLEIVGDAAHDAAIAGNPVRMAGRALTSDYTAVAAGDTADLITTLLGKLVTIPYANPANTWSYAAASGGITNTTGVTIKTAAGAGIRNYVTSVSVVNGHASVDTDVQIRDGASGTVLWRGFAKAGGGGVSATFDVPLRGSANTLLEVACGTTGSATYVNATGYAAAE